MAEKDTTPKPEPEKVEAPALDTAVDTGANAIYTPEQLQKAIEMARVEAYNAGKAEQEKEYRKQQELEEAKAKEDKRNGILDKIKSDESTKAWYMALDEQFEGKPLEWFETLELARTTNVEEFAGANTAPPVGSRTVGKSTSSDNYWDQKDAEKRAKAKGGK